MIPRELAIQHRAVPFRALGSELSIALLDVHNRDRYEQLVSAAATGVSIFIGNEARVLAALERYYDQPMSERFRQLRDRLDEQAAQRNQIGAKEPRGPLSSIPSHKRIARCWGGQMPSECLVLPIRIQKRLVSVVLIDPGPKGLGDPPIPELEKLAWAAADGLQDYIQRAKQNASTASN